MAQSLPFTSSVCATAKAEREMATGMSARALEASDLVIEAKERFTLRVNGSSEDEGKMKASMLICLAGRLWNERLRALANRAGIAALSVCLLAVTACSSSMSSSKPQVGPIAFTNANGTAQPVLTSLTSSQGTYLSVALTNDPKLLGADWSVTCSSALAPGAPLPPGWTQDESCGKFTPAHTTSTIDGKIPNYATSAQGYVTLYVAPATPPKEGTVTLYASATSDHSRLSSVTLTIGGLPVSVGFAPAPPATLHANASAQFRAVLNNDSANAGVKWTLLCGSNDCGSLDLTQTTSGESTTYTAPAAVPTGGTVQVTATSVADPTKTATAAIQIVP